MALGGFLGGLANLGTIYGGFQKARQQDIQNQLQQLQLQNTQAQLQGIQGAQGLALSGALDPRAQQTPQLLQPNPLPAVNIPQTAPVTPVQAQPLAPPATSTQLASAGPLGLAGLPTGGNPFGAGLPPLPGMSGFGGGLPVSQQPPTVIGGNIGGGSPFGPGQPLTGPAMTGTGLPLPSAPSFAGTGDGGGGTTVSPLDTTTTFGGLGPPPGQRTAQMDVVQFAPPSPTAGAEDQRTLGGIVQPAGGFGVPPQYADAAAAQRAGQAAVPGTADTGGYAQPPGTADTGQASSLFNSLIIPTESGGMNLPPNEAGATGPAQIIPSTFNQYARPGENIYNPSDNYQVGLRYFTDLLQKSGGDVAAALVGYNAGEGAMTKFQRSGDQLDSVPQLEPAYRRLVSQRLTGAAHADMSRNLPREYDSVGTTGALQLLRMIPQLPQAVQAMAPSQLAKSIDQAYPGASDLVKGSVFLKLWPMLNEQAKEQTAQAWEGWKYQMERLKFAEDVRHDVAGEAKDRAANWEILETPQGMVRVNKVSGQIQPLQGLPAGTYKPGVEPRTTYSQPFQQKDPATGETKTFRINNQTGQTEEIKLPGAGDVTKLGAPSQGAPLTDATAERYAKIYGETGYLPPGIARNSKAIAQIMNKTGATGSPGDFVANVASRQADTKSLGNMQKMADAAITYENTAIRNFDQALKYAEKGIPTDMGPWLNRWVATGETQAGNKDVPAYVVALLTAANEYAKVMSGSTGAAGATEGARAEAAAFFSPYLNQGQIKEVITVAKQEMENRKEELLSGIDDIKTRLRTPGGETTPRGHPAGEPVAAPQGGGGTSGTEAAIATMTRPQIYKFLQDNPEITDTQRASVARRLSELDAQERGQRQSQPPTNVVPPVR